MIRRGFLKILLMAVLVFSLAWAVIGFAANSEIAVTVDGQRIAFDNQQPAIVDGRTLVPVRGVFEFLGFDVDFDTDSRQVTLKRHDFDVILTVGNATFTTNGTSHSLDVPAQIIGGSTMLPIRAVLSSVGYYVDWSAATNTVIISSTPIAGQGSQAQEVDIVNHAAGWHSHHDGEFYFKSIVLMPMSGNIQSIELVTNTGFFATQHIPADLDINNTTTPLGISRQGDVLHVLMYGTDFEMAGDAFTFTSDDLDKGLLLFWGQEDANLALLNQAPQNLTINARITFNNGTVQTQSITVRFADTAGMSGFAAGEGDNNFNYEDWRRRLNAIPLAALTRVPGSMQILDRRTAFIPQNHFNTYDEFRVGMQRVIRGEAPEGTARGEAPSDVILSIIRLNDNGDLVSTDYIVPEHIAREFGF